MPYEPARTTLQAGAEWSNAGQTDERQMIVQPSGRLRYDDDEDQVEEQLR